MKHDLPLLTSLVFDRLLARAGGGTTWIRRKYDTVHGVYSSAMADNRANVIALIFCFHVNPSRVAPDIKEAERPTGR